MTQYPFTKTPVNINRLKAEILASAIAVEPCSVTHFVDALNICFDDALTTENETVLNGLVTAHAGVPIPPDVTPRQCRQALILSGVTMQQITDALNTLPSPQKELALAEWEYSTMFIRSNALVTSVGLMLGWTDQQLDDLWLLAATL